VSVWDRASFEERYAGLVVVLAVLWLAYERARADDRHREEHEQRQSVTLREESLARLERGERLDLPRWHGERLELVAASTSDDESSGTEDQDEEA
jgi:hypothetical protein